MPNRIIKESICSSPTIGNLSAEAERLFYRLLLRTDDHGVFKANTPIIKGECLPLVDCTPKQIEEWVKELQRAEMCALYEAEGRLWGTWLNWDKYNKPRTTNRKYPKPPDNICAQMQADDRTCKQMSAYTDTDTDTDTITPEPAQVSLPNTKTAFNDKDCWEYVSKFRELYKHFPDHPCNDAKEWNKLRYGWYRTFYPLSATKRKGLFEGAEWAIGEGWAIDSPATAKKRLTAIKMKQSTAPKVGKSEEHRGRYLDD